MQEFGHNLFLYYHLILKGNFMRKGAAILFSMAFSLNCSNDKDVNKSSEIPKLEGPWKLVEQLVDPGDGSGEFAPVTSNKTIEFFQNGTYMVNGSLCTIDADTGPVTTGTYVVGEELNDFSFENYLDPENCDFEGYKVHIVLDSSFLILSYPCIEGCAQKFIKT
jgi:hypothetical protein